MADDNHSTPRLTATRFMAQFANRLTEFHPGFTAQEVVDGWTDSTVEAANDGKAVGSHAVTSVRAVRYQIESGGPSLDVTFVFAYVDEGDDDPDGPALDYAIIDYTESGPRAQRVVAGWAAERLYRALRDGNGETG